MDVSSYNHSASINISRSPADLYEMVSNVGGIGELSPVCRSGIWDDPQQAGTTGAWFTGHNAIGDFTWDTRCRVVLSEPPREFVFVNCGPSGENDLVRWGYKLEAAGDGTDVTELWQVLPAYPDFVREGDESIDVKARIDGMAVMAREGIAATLANLKRIAES
jgi:hypothetical protein